MDPEIAASALRHGVTPEDILHAYRNFIRGWDMDDDFVMVIGPSRAGMLLEIGFLRGVPNQVIVHAMKARPKFMR